GIGPWPWMSSGPYGRGSSLVAGRARDVVHAGMGCGWLWAVPGPCGLLGLSSLLVV
ncbi:hypothetical protein Tco_1135846, partial [Tanacetum coccineum]